MTLKQTVHQHYQAALHKKIMHLQHILADLKESAANETKSTAGDKHETALAMLQIEQANVGSQLKDALDQQGVLEKINPSLVTFAVVQGSLLKTNRGYLFISTALGKAIVHQQTIMAISPQSPLGKQLMGLQVGQSTTMNGHLYQLEAIE